MNDGAPFEGPVFPGISTEEVRPQSESQEVGTASAHVSSQLPPITTDSPDEAGKSDSDQLPLPENENETWTEAKNQRRCDLIDRKYAGGLTPAETRELAQLHAQMLRHSQRVAPLPIEAADRLYKELLAGVNAARSPKNP
jgi:hypothetical protein